MTAVFQLVLSVLTATLAYVIYSLRKDIWLTFFSGLRDLPGPKRTNWLYGHTRELSLAEHGVLFQQWLKEYGDTFKFSYLFGRMELFTIDARALHHILMHSEVYEKPLLTRQELRRIFGPGLLVVEGEEHKKQRRIMNPAFGPTQVRELTEIFLNKAEELRAAWSLEIARAGETAIARVDIFSWLSKMTLDVIGLAGFNYKFDALNTEAGPNELNEAFATIFAHKTKFTFFQVLRAVTPLKFIAFFISSKKDKVIKGAEDAMRRIGRQLLDEAKADIRVSEKNGAANDMKRRDLLSLLVRANAGNDVKEEQKLSDDDVIAQINTFIVAGHETTSSGVTWALYALAETPNVQNKLRTELCGLSTETPTMEELSSLSYLDMVVREVLRLYAPVPETVRISVKDDVVPFEKPFIDENGIKRDRVEMRKGDIVHVPIAFVNKSPAVWGEDANEFRPERWETVPEAAHDIPGIYSNLLTFLGGPRACIGWRFSLIETKAILFTLVRAFEFEPVFSPAQIKRRSELVLRPSVRGEEEKGNQMPLLIKPAKDVY